jgi:hypothetical protein
MGVPVPLFMRKVIYMNNKEFNEQRHNRMKQLYRFILGIQRLLNYPILNLLWIIFVVGVVLMNMAEKRYIAKIEVYPMFTTIFSVCITIILIIFPVICAIGIIQLVGFCAAIKDEADMEIVFGDKRDVKNQPPILIYKKKDKVVGVTKREFYTTVPMERWQEKKEAICDRLDIHLIGDITYGGRKKNKGNHIYFESAKGRNPIERGVLYDDTF